MPLFFKKKKRVFFWPFRINTRIRPTISKKETPEKDWPSGSEDQGKRGPGSKFQVGSFIPNSCCLTANVHANFFGGEPFYPTPIQSGKTKQGKRLCVFFWLFLCVAQVVSNLT